MPHPASEPSAPSPVAAAGVLLAAIYILRDLDLDLPCPTVRAVIEATGASKTRAYQIRDELLNGVLPNLIRPVGRPPIPPSERPDTSSISLDVIAFLMNHPGAVTHSDTGRQHYGDTFRHFVLEQAAKYPDLPVGDLARAVVVPKATIEDWLKPRSRAPSEPSATPPPTSGQDPIENPSDESLVDATSPRIATILEAWDHWKGGFKPFCWYVRKELHIPYGFDLVRHILEIHKGRHPRRRSGRSPDESASRDSLRTFFSGAQWFEDGSSIGLTINGITYTYNWELTVDAYSNALVGSAVREQEDAEGVIESFHDGVTTTGSSPVALSTDNRESNHTEEVQDAIDPSLHIRSTLGHPQNDAPIEGAFGNFQQTAPLLVVEGDTPRELGQSILRVVLETYIRVMNNRPRHDRNGRSRAEIYFDDLPTEEQFAAATAWLEELQRKHEKAFQTRQARLDPIVRALLDKTFERLGLDDPNGNVKNAIARYPLDHVLTAIATFEAKKDQGTLPPDAGARYLLGIVCHTSEIQEGLAIAERLWQARSAAQDRAILSIERERDSLTGTPTQRIFSCIDRSLATDGPLNRTFWLRYAAEIISGHPDPERNALFMAATRRIHGTFRVERLQRQAAVAYLASIVVPVS
jgi:hypothetical protein